MRWGGTPRGEPLRFNEAIMLNGLVFWIILLLMFMAAYAWVRKRTAAGIAMPPRQTGVPPSAISAEARGVLEVKFAPLLVIIGHKVLGKVVQFTGHLNGKSHEMFRKIRETFKSEPLSQLSPRPVVLPGPKTEQATERPRWALPLLFGSGLLEKRIDCLRRKKART